MNQQFEFKTIPLEELEPYTPSFRSIGTPLEEAQLHDSISKFGIIVPLIVSRLEEGRYRIVDGHRRWSFSKELGQNETLCIVRPKMSKGEIELLRYQLHNL